MQAMMQGQGGKTLQNLLSEFSDAEMLYSASWSSGIIGGTPPEWDAILVLVAGFGVGFAFYDAALDSVDMIYSCQRGGYGDFTIEKRPGLGALWVYDPATGKTKVGNGAIYALKL